MCDNDDASAPRFTRWQAEMIMAAFDAAFKAGPYGDEQFQKLNSNETFAAFEAEQEIVVAILKQYPDFYNRYPTYIAAMKTGW